MYKIAIFTAGKAGERIYDVCRKIEDVEVVAFVDNIANLYANRIEEIPIVSPFKLKRMVMTSDINLVLVPSHRMISYGLREHTLQLDKLNIDCYKIVPSWIIRKDEIEDNDIQRMDMIIKEGRYRTINQLQHLQFHVIDNCNLNCKRCHHFSNMAKPESYADYESVIRDFVRLRELFDDIGTIAILGGEPLLNPDLSKYIGTIRGLFEHSRLEIITNGILIRNMNSELIDTIKRNNVIVNVSYYPVLENTIEDIVNFLDKNKIRYHIGPHIDAFSKSLTLNENTTGNLQDVYNTCRDECCTTLRDHKIYPCYLPASVHIFNEQFSKAIDGKDCGIDIFEENISGIDIVERLKKPFDICKYCGDEETYSWEQTENVALDDWAV